jgi:methylmalonyl-CoA/ethylmalonyl-CoA epimerase
VEARSLHHVAMAVDDLDEAVATYQRLLGATVEVRGRMEDQGVEAAYLRVGGGRVELVRPLGEDTPVGRFLANRGPGMHHLAFEVEDVEETIAELAGRGAELIDERPRAGLDGHEVSFIHPDSLHGVLLEVVGA